MAANGDVAAEQRGAKALAALFAANVTVMTCQRCKKTVYAKEKITSSKDIIFHKGCFTCKECSTSLTTGNHRTSVDRNDPEIYCMAHVPKLKGKSLAMDARGILSAVEQSRMRERLAKIATLKGPHMPAETLAMQHALAAQKLNKYGGKAEEQHMYPALLVSRHRINRLKDNYWAFS